MAMDDHTFCSCNKTIRKPSDGETGDESCAQDLRVSCLECTLTVGSEYSGLKGEPTRHALFGALMVVTAGAEASVTRAIGGPGSHTCAGVPGAILQGDSAGCPFQGPGIGVEARAKWKVWG